MKKKLLFIYYQNIKQNGISKSLANLSSALVDEGYDVSILFLMAPHEDFFPIHEKVKKIYINSFQTPQFRFASRMKTTFGLKGKLQNIVYNIYDYGVFRLLKKWINDNGGKYDDIITCWYKLSTYGTFTRYSKKILAWEHINYSTGGLIYYRLLRNRYKKLKGIVCLTKDSLGYYKGLSPNSINIPNIIGNQFENYVLYFDEKEDVIFLASRLDPEKNVREFLEIINEADIPKNWKVIIAGTGQEESALKNKALQLGLSNVTFLGSVTPKEMPDLYRKSKIFCMTSLFEGLPTTLIEAMFFGNALISYDCPTGPSEIINEKNGFLIPLRNKEEFESKIKFLVENNVELQNLIKSSYENASNWRQEQVIEKWKMFLK